MNLSWARLQVPREWYRPQSLEGGGEARRERSQLSCSQHAALALEVPAPVVVLQRLLVPQVAVLVRNAAVFVPAESPAAASQAELERSRTQATRHGADVVLGVRIGGVWIGSKTEDNEVGWRVGRMVYLARAACMFAAQSPRYHHTLHLFFLKFSELLGALPSPVSVGKGFAFRG